MPRWLVLPNGSQVLAVHAVLLHTGASGQILFFSGDEHDQGQHNRGEVDHTRLFDCATLTVTTLGSPVADLFCAGHAFLGDGRVLVAGGTEDFPDMERGLHAPHFPGLREAWIFDPAVMAWRGVAPMNPEPGLTTGGGRWYPTLVSLQNGQVLAVSGHPRADDTRHTNNSPELYVPDSPAGRWLLLGPADPEHEMTYYPRMHLLPGGQVFCASPVMGRTQMLDPATGTWTDLGAGAPGDIHVGTDGTSVLLPLLPEEGYRARILFCGDAQPLLFDFGDASPGWRPTGRRTLAGAPPRRNVSAVLLPTGEVFVCGGVSAGDSADASAVLAAELYQPSSNQWTTLEAATVPRNYHSVALLMPDGRVWTAGSNHNAEQSFIRPGVDNRELRFELYEPWYYTEPRPQLTSVPAVLDYGQTFQLQSPQAATIQRVALVRAGSATHGFDSDQRYIGLRFTHSGGDRLEVSAPEDSRIAPPGSYLLFILDARGVPSEGRFVRFNAFAFAGNPTLIQGRFGVEGNFEMVVPLATEGLAHFWRNNDVPSLPWNGPLLFGTEAGHVDAASLIQSNFGSPGSLEVVARLGGRLALFWNPEAGADWQGPLFFAADASGNPAFIQGRFGVQGNFEVVVPLARGGLAHYWRDNDSPSLPWHGPIVFGTDAGRVDAVSLIQSNFGSPGSLEVVARAGDRLLFFWRESEPPYTWHGPSFLASGVAGVPSFIQGRFGAQGNFELVVPLATGGLAHYLRDNDSPSLPWHGPIVFGTDAGRVDAVSLIQSNFGSPGSLEVVARAGHRLLFFWRESEPPFTWHGPSLIAPL